MATNTLHNQTFNLPDGRKLGYAEYGSPEGRPLLYFHGYPSSRLEFGSADAIARRLGIRVFALDRPGFGLSTPQPGRRLLDWPIDVKTFAQGMGLSRFAIMGISGGGPFAVACAYALPQSMLTGVGLFASAPPWAAGAHHMSLYRRITSVAAVYWPSGLRFTLAVIVGFTRWLANTGPVVRRIDRWLEQQKKKRDEDLAGPENVSDSGDVVERTTEERRKSVLRILIDEPFAQGAGAATLEAKLLSAQDWGFRLEDVPYDTIKVWHGAEDRNAPVIAIRYMAERLPRCVLKEFEGDSHYTMFKHVEGALAELVPEQPLR